MARPPKQGAPRLKRSIYVTEEEWKQWDMFRRQNLPELASMNDFIYNAVSNYIQSATDKQAPTLQRTEHRLNELKIAVDSVQNGLNVLGFLTSAFFYETRSIAESARADAQVTRATIQHDTQEAIEAETDQLFADIENPEKLRAALLKRLEYLFPSYGEITRILQAMQRKVTELKPQQSPTPPAEVSD